MTTPKLHDAAVRAADELGRNQEDRDSGAEIISVAIDDHLKSEGWTELEETLTEYFKELDNPIPDWTMRRVDREKAWAALCRVRGKTP